MKKFIIGIFIFFNIIIMYSGHVYFNYEDNLIESYYELGINQEFKIKNIYFGFDTSYYSPEFNFNNFTFLPGFAKYDFWLGVKYNKLKLEYFHRCIHKFDSIIYSRWENKNYFDTGKNKISIKYYF